MIVERPLALLATVADHRRRQVGASPTAIVRLFRYPQSTALMIAASRAQIGEFSFILAGLGVDARLLPPRSAAT